MILKKGIIVLGLFLSLSFIFISCGGSSDTTISENSNCGNGVIDNLETCDKDQVDCSSLDSRYLSGTALCKSDCSDYDISDCVDPNQLNKVTITVSTETFNGRYAPKNVLAIWIEDSEGKYIKTLLVKAMERRSKLDKWFSVSNRGINGIMVDTISSATRKIHQIETVSWNLKDLQNYRVADGEYTIWFELNEDEGISKKNSAKIEISNNFSIISIGSSLYFPSIEITFE